MRYLSVFLVLMFLNVSLYGDVKKLLFSHYTNSYKSQQSYKTLSELNVSVTVAEAYEIQQKLVQNMLTNKTKRGFKVGLTSPEKQKQYNISEPILGVLVSDQIYQNFSVIPKRSFTDLYFETEFGFVLKRNITKRIESLYILKQQIKSVYPVIEVVDFKFLRKQNVQIGDLIMANVLSSSYLLGPELSLQSIQNLPIQAVHSGELVSSYNKEVSVDDYLLSLMWAINTALDQGWKVAKDDIIITGALGTMFSGKKGRYIVDYGDLTSVMFDVR